MSIFNIPPGFIKPPKDKPLPKFIDALEITESDVNYTSHVKKDPRTGLLYTDLGYQIQLIDQAFVSINARIDELVESTTFESALTDLWAQIDSNTSEINTIHDDNMQLSIRIDGKLDKLFTNVALANELADEDYFVLNRGSAVYRINVATMRSIFGSGGQSGVVNHYKGDFLHYNGLVEAYPSAEPGDYAFVNTTEDENVDKLVLYIWDDDANLWKETTSDKYVLSENFVSLQEGLLDGTFVVKKSDVAVNYLDSQNSLRKIADAIENRVEKVAGKQLTTNDFTDSYKAKLDGIAEEETDPTVPAWAKQANKPTYSYNELTDKPTIPSITGLASEAFVTQKIAELINSAPTTLDTLGEIAAALQENEDVVEALNNAITNKQDKLTPGEGISISNGVISVSYPNYDEEEF